MNRLYDRAPQPENLILENVKLARFVANKYRPLAKRHRIDYEDVLGVGMIGLVKAAKTFDASRGARFSTYAYLKISGEIRYFFRTEKKLVIPIMSIQDSVGEEEEGTVEDFLGREDDFHVIETVVDFHEFYDSLPQREQKVLALRSCGRTQAEIASVAGVSETHVCRILKKIKEQYRKEAAT